MSQDKCTCNPTLFEGEWRHMARCPLWWKTKSAEKIEMPEVIKRALENGDAVHATTATAEKHTHAPEHAGQCPECLGATVIHPTDTSDWRERFKEKFSWDMARIYNDAFDAGKAAGRAEEAINCHEHVERARDDAHKPYSKGFEAGLAEGRQHPLGTYQIAFEAGHTVAIAEVKEMITGMKKYGNGHNAAHTWIENGYCHGCEKHLTQTQLEEEFGYNVALSDLLTKLTDKQK